MLVFLFTDIEGSTQLWEVHTAQMGKIIARHDALLQQQITACGGQITKHTGDGITAALEAGEPVACALELQKHFAAEPRGAIGELRIRVGLHAGKAEWLAGPQPGAGDYHGPLVNCTARIMSAAWGGQILLTTAVTSASPLPSQASLQDLGQHLLKDVSTPQQIFQLLHPELPRGEFPPLRTLSGQSISQAVGQQGGRLADLSPSAMAVGLASAALIPILQGDLSPSSEALAGNLGVLGDLGANTLRGFLAEMRVRQALQREQLDLQRQQLVKINILLQRQQEGAAVLAPAGLPASDTEDLPTAGPAPADVPCPYKGLAASEPEDAEVFFGREELVAELTARLAGTRFLAVVDPSGSGKSSVARLAMAGEWAETHGDEMNPLEREFLAASQELAQRREAEREVRRQRDLEAERKRAEEQARNTRRLLWLVAALAVVFLLAVGAAIFARGQQQAQVREAEAVAAQATVVRQAGLTSARHLATLAMDRLENNELVVALLLAIEAVRAQDRAEAQSSLLTGLQYSAHLLAFLYGHDDLVTSVALSPDGRTLAAGSGDGSITLWDTTSRELKGELLSGHGGPVTSLAFSPDGQTLASAGDEQPIVLWDVDLGSWLTRACGIANRNLTAEEWERYLGEQPYRKTCPELP